MDKMRELHKFSLPVAPSPLLHRENLVQTLVDAVEPRTSGWPSPYSLVLLCAPAGYGKTILLLDTLSRLSSACCWYTLDKSDADCAVFVRGLYTSIRCQFPTFGESFAALLETHTESAENGSLTSSSIELLADALIDALKHEIVQQFVLVLCNYQEVNACEAVNRLVDRLLSALPQWGTVIIESQGMPDLMVAPLIANRQMFGIGSQLLRFNQQEVYELARLQGFTSFSPSEAEQLTRTFDGWIIGILLGSRLGYTQGHHPTSLQATYWGETVFGGDHKQILEYITNKVFKHEAATYAFLRQVAIFTRLTPAYCNALLEINDAEERLIYAERRGLFLIKDRQNGDPSEAGDYICHPVLRQLFLEQLRQQTSDEYKALHKRAALILQTHHQYGQALMHAYQAQEYHFAAQIIIEGASAIIYEEHSEMIWHWLKMLPEEIFKQYPRLLLIASNIHLRHGEFALVPPLLDTVDALLNSGTEAEDVRASELLQAELFIAHGHLSFFQGEFQRTQEFCQQALALLPPDERRLHIRAYQYKGIALIVGDGQIQEGIIQLQLALQMSRTQNNERQVATLHRLVANAYSWIGNHTLAEHHQLRAFQIWEKLHNNQGIIYGLTSMGLLKMRQGFVADAGTLLQRSLTLSRAHPPFKSGEAYALVGLGDLSNNQGKYAEALIYLEDGLNLARACEDHYLTCCGLCHLALAYLFLGDTQTAQFFLDQISLKEGEKLSFEGYLFALTQGTVFLTQQDNGKAQDTLLHASEITQRASVQILYVSALLRLAVSYLRQNKKQLAAQVRQQIIELNNKGDFDFLIQVEIHRYTELVAFLEQTSTHEPTSEVEQNNEDTPQPSIAKLAVVSDELDTFPFQIIALGEPQVLTHGIPVTHWRMARSMELFFFLLATDHPVRKEQIELALWPEDESEHTDATVRTIIYYLRKALGKDSIVFQGGLYNLDTKTFRKDKIWYDVDIFDKQYMQARAALEAEDDDTAANIFHNVLSLYKGDYVQSFYNDWCIFQRDRLRQSHMDIHHQLALIYWRREDWDTSLSYWQRLLSLDACYEAAHYGIMRCYLQQGKRESALRQFQSCRQILHDELQTAPKASIQKLYRTIIGSSD